MEGIKKLAKTEDEMIKQKNYRYNANPADANELEDR